MSRRLLLPFTIDGMNAILLFVVSGLIAPAMVRRWAGVAVIAAGMILVGACTQPQPSSTAPGTPGFARSMPQGLPGDEPPPAPREMRAAWVATVANIDWPSRRDLSPEAQRREMLAILDRAASLRLNAIILQVRPSADAIYPSPLEPWSEYLTGEQGRAPQPFYDPLAAWIEEAHRRGLELHAWFNPYRARHAKALSKESPAHVTRRMPAVVKAYGDYLWMDPGEPRAAQHTLEVILDVVRRYDIDAVHIDDYFYPYPVAVAGAQPPRDVDFPDEPSWRAYVARGGALSRADWRRQNVNLLIERIHDELRRVKPWVRFGVSPFGLGRPERRPPGIAGFSQYDKLYADVELWMRRCWVDYLVPQLYWPIAQAPQAFNVLLDHWIAENTCGRHLMAGLYTSRIDYSPQTWAVSEVLNQIAETRRRAGAHGHVHFSMVSLLQNRAGVSDALASAAYRQAALMPASTWIDARRPQAPLIAVGPSPDPLPRSGEKASRLRLDITPQGERPIARWAVWARAGGEWRFFAFPARDRVPTLAAWDGLTIDRLVVSAVDRLGNESDRVAVEPVYGAAQVEADIVPATAWGGAPAAANAKRQSISRITLHHQGLPYPPGRDPREYLRSLQKWSREARGWSDIPYHFVIDLQGRIYAARPLDIPGDTQTGYDPAGHALIQVVGDYDAAEPNAAQLHAAARLMGALAQRYHVPLDRVSAHRDHARDTSCPGKNLYAYFENGWFAEQVKRHARAARP